MRDRIVLECQTLKSPSNQCNRIATLAPVPLAPHISHHG